MVSFKKICRLIFSFLITVLVLFSYFSLSEVSALVVGGDSLSENEDKNEDKVDYYEFVDSLRKEYNNDDIVGKIKIDGTFLDEIIVQGNDNSYYLSHDNYKNYSIAGSLFVDSRVNIDDDKKILIYGHNSSKGNRPFSVLEGYYYYEYFVEHPVVELTVDKGIRKFQIFAVYVETGDWGYMKVSFNDDNQFLAHINSLKEKSLYDTGVLVNADDRVLILQTCSYHKNYRRFDKKYLLVLAKEIKSSN